MSAQNNQVNIHFDDLKDTVSYLDKAYEYCGDLELSSVKSPDNSEIYITNCMNNAVKFYNQSCNDLKNKIDILRSAINAIYKKMMDYDSTENKEVSEKTTTSSGGKSQGKTGRSATTPRIKPVSNANSVQPTVYKPVEKTITPVVVPVTDANTGSTVSPVDDVRNEALQQLDTYLKKGDLGAALTSYKLLKALGSDKEADEYLKKYGYKVMEKDGDYIITKIEDPNPSNSNTNINKNQTETPNNSNNEVVAEEVASPSNNVSNTNTNQRQNLVRTNNVNNNQQSATNNPSIESNATNSTSSTPNDGQPSINKTNDIKTNKSNIVTIKDDTPNSTKKSSGIGTAIPVGLGTIAVGAAAVAGVRYAKNKKKDQEDYDENYDDENNDLDNDNEYVDSAQYNNDNDYTADDYLGPAGSNYTDVDSDNIEDDYVDPEELEPDEDEDLSSDIVLDQLNLNS